MPTNNSIKACAPNSAIISIVLILFRESSRKINRVDE